MQRSTTTGPGKGKGTSRGRRGFVQTGALVGKRIRGATEKRGFSELRLLTHWTEIAGPDLSRIARPVKVSYARDGFGATLTLLAHGAYGPELDMQLPAIRDKVNACYGYNAIARVRVTQTSSHGFAEDQAGFDGAPPRRPSAPEPDPERLQALDKDLSELSDPGLKAALERLGRNILARK
ncbi:DUF721 domain-containing protein [Oceanomicrobium pacificus]|uniref:DUF721 domain-containing protein n=1 Tax=Oceanomicrobium pacificus TaxID=2692916 RepID=A0A6B0TUJ9_9RHOB|nr:DciA family protein [Oceanomicrobium pacificus]MXU64844.1 DUF721 domain-containing protein [Oceanomicrobium pacificus]